MVYFEERLYFQILQGHAEHVGVVALGHALNGHVQDSEHLRFGSLEAEKVGGVLEEAVWGARGGECRLVVVGRLLAGRRPGTHQSLVNAQVDCLVVFGKKAVLFEGVLYLG